jgi:hypothetical protein
MLGQGTDSRPSVDGSAPDSESLGRRTTEAVKVFLRRLNRRRFITSGVCKKPALQESCTACLAQD